MVTVAGTDRTEGLLLAREITVGTATATLTYTIPVIVFAVPPTNEDGDTVRALTGF
jgi:hypothetical protein